MFNIGPTELVIILVIALIVFGPKRLPEMMRTFGKSVREFRRASDELTQDLRLDLDDRPSFPAPVTPPASQGILARATPPPDEPAWQGTGDPGGSAVAGADHSEPATSSASSDRAPGEGVSES